MTKQKGALPTRRRRDRSRDGESLLLRSAESLGRVIGALQRQLDGATRRLAAAATEASETRRGTKKRRATETRAGAKKAKGAARKVTGSAARKKTKKRWMVLLPAAGI